MLTSHGSQASLSTHFLIFCVCFLRIILVPRKENARLIFPILIPLKIPVKIRVGLPPSIPQGEGGQRFRSTAKNIATSTTKVKV